MKRGQFRDTDIPLAGPLHRGRKKNVCVVLAQRFILCWLVILILLCIFYWLWKPSAYEMEDLHLTHDLYANFYAISDWVWEQVTTCSSPLPPGLTVLAIGKIRNSNFDENLYGWKTLEGYPAIHKQNDRTGVFNAFWVGQEGSVDGFTTSVQYLDLTESSDINILDSIYSNNDVDIQFYSEDEKKHYLFQGLIDYNSILINATCLLRKPSTINPKTECGTRNHFCDRHFNDHVWIEIEYWVRKIEITLCITYGLICFFFLFFLLE